MFLYWHTHTCILMHSQGTMIWKNTLEIIRILLKNRGSSEGTLQKSAGLYFVLYFKGICIISGVLCGKNCHSPADKTPELEQNLRGGGGSTKFYKFL